MTFYYPNGKPYKEPCETGKKTIKPMNKNKIQYGNRGMSLEDDLNLTNRYYLERQMAVVHKKPTPVQIVKVDYPKRSQAKITEAYYRRASTTDYNGVFQGKYIDFEAKETHNVNLLPLKNFHDHQIKHMRQVMMQQGICFIIIKFSKKQDVYLLDAGILIRYWDLQHTGGRKSIPRETIEREGYLVPQSYLPRLDYLSVVKQVYL
ncbi:Holliday junction resolvase RecU [Terrilactibacillus sp. BCM23-1]|uniref:Holliday junction resolvase RecU n=1 Tax=Terrilactibacillus tamarindi TaxID=2599694 RepID=A0A6N8CR15_9BACI|nr:Holliday junction resolvase RecU [Terrilactibacillus tamarindi]MTT32612.1 Holliday junction resolvase RecU [Terrilactibacillus tamarindi]